MKDTIGLILLVALIAFIFSPEWLGQQTKRMLQAFQTEATE